MRFNLILLQMLSSDPRIFLAQANANDGKLELHSPPSSLLPTLQARSSAPSTHFSLPSPPSSLPWTPTAKCPRTIFFSLLPPPYSRNTRQLCRAGAPERAIHALFPPLSSLLSTLHFSLPSPPSSLLWTPTAKCPRTSPSPLLPTLYSPLNYVNSVHKCAGCVPFLFFGIIRGVHPVHCAGK